MDPRMRYAVVFAHPNPKSFNRAVLERVEANLSRAGRDYVVRDLYAMRFGPSLEAADFEAIASRRPLPEVAEEQRIIAGADRILFIHPIWWYGMPAILKGYIDRVFTRGFAYDYGREGLVGLLAGKRAYAINTTGNTRENYERYGYRDAIAKAIDEGTLGACGLKVVERRFLYAVPSATPEERAAMLDEVERMDL